MARQYSVIIKDGKRVGAFKPAEKVACQACGFSFEWVNPRTGICNSCKNATQAAHA